jgi:hypothetical protein
MGFEPRTPVFEQVQRVHTLHCPVTVFDMDLYTDKNVYILCVFGPYLSLTLHLFLSSGIYNSCIILL